MSSTPLDAAALASALSKGDRRALARAITLVESTREDHRASAAELLQKLAARPADTLRVGVTGVPGVGKSTLIEALGEHILSSGRRLAVLTVDPSSARSGGSILGDKTRMPRLSASPDAFIRPSPSGGTLGGVARHTRESIVVCEAAGFDVVLVETVGVGQSEVAVANMTDVFLLALLPGGGDELQGIKRGIMELADIVLVNKADGELARTAKRTAADFANAIRLLRPRHPDWTVPVEACSALDGASLRGVWSHILRLAALLKGSGELDRRRAEQALTWMWEDTLALMKSALESDRCMKRLIDSIESDVRRGALPATVAAERLVAAFLKQRGHK